MKRGAIHTMSALLVLVLACGCGGAPMRQVKATPRAVTTELRGGVSSVDITPPVGLSMWGYGPEGRVAEGVLLHLGCTAFVFTAGSAAVALVPCELGIPSREIHSRVASELIEADVPIAANELFIMATHTHAAPGHFMGTNQYAGAFGSRAPGYDPEVVRFLAERVAAAISSAWASREPVSVRWQQDATGGSGLTKNRSLGAFRHNVDYHAGVPEVDPSITLMRVDALGPPRLLGVLGIFGIHNTAIGNDNIFYHGDVFGYARRYLTKAIVERGDKGVQVALAAGIEGDVSPAVTRQSPLTSRAHGRELAGRMLEAFEKSKAATPETGPLRRAYRELFMPGQIADVPSGNMPAWWVPAHPLQAPAWLCRSPSVGTAAAGGAEDGLTRLRILPPMEEGMRSVLRPGRDGSDLPDDGDRCHAPKRAVVSPAGYTTAGNLDPRQVIAEQDFPGVAPIGAIQLGSTLLVTLPGEMTTTVGASIRERLTRFMAHEGDAAARVVPIGLTNVYLQYIATADEYDEQHYEGASTLYGRHSARMFERQLLCLVSWLKYPQRRSLDGECRLEQPYRVDELVQFAKEPAARKVSRLPAADDSDVPLLDFGPVKVEERRFDGVRAWRAVIHGPKPGHLRDKPLTVRVLEKDTNQVIADQDGVELRVHYRGWREEDDPWEILWVPDPETLAAVKGKRLTLDVDAILHWTSEPFDVAQKADGAPPESEVPTQQIPVSGSGAASQGKHATEVPRGRK